MHGIITFPRSIQIWWDSVTSYWKHNREKDGTRKRTLWSRNMELETFYRTREGLTTNGNFLLAIPPSARYSIRLSLLPKPHLFQHHKHENLPKTRLPQ